MPLHSSYTRRPNIILLQLLTRMKRILLYIIATTLLTGSFTACDVIGENDRYIKVTIPEPPTTAVKRVLIEEFTGRKCPNCPTGAQTIADIQAYYEGRVVAVAIHAGMYAMPTGTAFRDLDLRTDAGNTYNETYAPQGYPAAMINRNTYDGVVASTIRDKWMTSVISELAGEPVMEIIPTCSYDETTRTATITTTIEALQNMPEGLNLQIYLTESGIVAAQMNGNELINDYVHNHVLRSAVNGTWGRKPRFTASRRNEKLHPYHNTPCRVECRQLPHRSFCLRKQR